MTNLERWLEQSKKIRDAATHGLFSQGSLLHTRETMKWSVSERLLADAQERRRVFVNFHVSDQGKSRQLVGEFISEHDAKFTVTACNDEKLKDQVIAVMFEALDTVVKAGKISTLSQNDNLGSAVYIVNYNNQATTAKATIEKIEQLAAQALGEK